MKMLSCSSMSEPKIADCIEKARRLRREGDLDLARQLMVAVVDSSRKEGGPEFARSLAGLAQLERDLGNIDAALRMYTEAAAEFQRFGHLLGFAHALRHAADIHQDAGRGKLAEPLYLEALAVYRSNPDAGLLDTANAVRGFAELKQKAGATAESRQLWEEARNLYRLTGVQAGVEESTRRLEQLAEAH